MSSFNLPDIQGNILRGYGHTKVRHLFLKVTDRSAARQFLAVSAAGGRKDQIPGITPECEEKRWSKVQVPSSTPASQEQSPSPEPKEPRPVCFNIGLTYEGLRVLGAPKALLASFPKEFIEGPAEPVRAMKLGDFGTSAPDMWAKPFNKETRADVHIIASIYADLEDELKRVQDQVERAFEVLAYRDGRKLADDKVFFGYRDGIAQPRFKHIQDASQASFNELFDRRGTLLLGHHTRFEKLMFEVPADIGKDGEPVRLGRDGVPRDPHDGAKPADIGKDGEPVQLGRDGVPMDPHHRAEPVKFGHNGTFNAFRILAQDCSAFETYLTDAARALIEHPKLSSPDKLQALLLARPLVGKMPDDTKICTVKTICSAMGCEESPLAAVREVIAAQMCGRWRDQLGTPVSLPPRPHMPEPPRPLPSEITNFDYDGATGCPAGAHIRRTNPRDGQIVQRVANLTRRIVRRGMCYHGPDPDPNQDDKLERGLLGNFIGANLGGQFEAIMCDWANLGLHDPDITGANDPIIGANMAETSWFDIALNDGDTIRLRGFPRFVTTRGSAYTFLPSLPAIRYLAKLQG